MIGTVHRTPLLAVPLSRIIECCDANPSAERGAQGRGTRRLFTASARSALSAQRFSLRLHDVESIVARHCIHVSPFTLHCPCA